MADLYMHSRLTEELIKELPSDIDTDIAFLGSQGPDPLYYKSDSKYHDIANNIHRYHSRSFFKTMTNYVKENNSKTNYSFLIGFISHYAMDVLLHPYVYHKVGIYKKNDPSTKHMRGLHLKFERAIDCLLIKKELNIPSRKLKLTKKYFPIKLAPKEVSELIAYTLKKELKVEDGFDIYTSSVKLMYLNFKYMVADRFGIKKQFYKLADLFTKERDMFFSSLSFFNALEDYDYHNDSQTVWHHPLLDETYTKTVQDLFEEAKVFALNIITEVDNYINHNKDVNLDEIFTDLSFNSGTLCELGMDFKYFDIYKK
jgi:hypothetical protein